jgi:hypothetical protein
LSLHPATAATTAALKASLHSAVDTELQRAVKASLHSAVDTELQRAVKAGLHSAVDTELQRAVKASLHSAVDTINAVNTIQDLPTGTEHSAQDVYSWSFIVEHAGIVRQQHVHTSHVHSRIFIQRNDSHLIWLRHDDLYASFLRFRHYLHTTCERQRRNFAVPRRFDYRGDP